MREKISFYYALPSVVVSVLLAAFAVSAWSEPTAIPPGDNVSPPLNISLVDQSKEGGLILNTGGASANGLVVQNGNVGIGAVAPQAKLTVIGGAILASGAIGGTPVSGTGTRLMWIPGKAAFRAGTVYNGTEWDDVNIGNESFAVGEDTIASGWASFASGDDSTASGYISTAMGWNTEASGDFAVAMGEGSIAHGNDSFAVGYWNRAYDHAMALGANAYADSIYSVAIGEITEVGINSDYSQAIGSQVKVADNTYKAMVLGMGSNTGAGVQYITNNIPYSLMVGFNSDTPTFFVGPSAGAGTIGNVGIGTTNPGAKLEVNGGMRLNTTEAKPVCDSSKRGTFWFTQGAAGVQDNLEICAKDSADSYAWRIIY